MKVENLSQPVPKNAESRLMEFNGTFPSNEAKAAFARWFAELVVHDFMLQGMPQEETKRTHGLGGLIKLVKGKGYISELTEALEKIRCIGNRGVHYDGQPPTEEEAEEVYNLARELFYYLVLDEVVKRPLNLNPARATIFSVIFPQVRAFVIQHILEKGVKDRDYEKGLIHKYALVLTKMHKFDKAIDFLDSMYKKGKVDKLEYQYEICSINAIKIEFDNDMLPVAKDMADFKRNLSEVLKSINEKEREENKELISIFENLTEKIDSSSFGQSIPNLIVSISLNLNGFKPSSA